MCTAAAYIHIELWLQKENWASFTPHRLKSICQVRVLGPYVGTYMFERCINVTISPSLEVIIFWHQQLYTEECSTEPFFSSFSNTTSILLKSAKERKMQFGSAFLAVLSATAVSAHFKVKYPYWRGDSLVTQNDYPCIHSPLSPQPNRIDSIPHGMELNQN